MPCGRRCSQPGLRTQMSGGEARPVQSLCSPWPALAGRRELLVWNPTRPARPAWQTRAFQGLPGREPQAAWSSTTSEACLALQGARHSPTAGSLSLLQQQPSHLWPPQLVTPAYLGPCSSASEQMARWRLLTLQRHARCGAPGQTKRACPCKTAAASADAGTNAVQARKAARSRQQGSRRTAPRPRVLCTSLRWWTWMWTGQSRRLRLRPAAGTLAPACPGLRLRLHQPSALQLCRSQCHPPASCLCHSRAPCRSSGRRL